MLWLALVHHLAHTCGAADFGATWETTNTPEIVGSPSLEPITCVTINWGDGQSQTVTTETPDPRVRGSWPLQHDYHRGLLLVQHQQPTSKSRADMELGRTHHGFGVGHRVLWLHEFGSDGPTRHPAQDGARFLSQWHVSRYQIQLCLGMGSPMSLICLTSPPTRVTSPIPLRLLTRAE